MKGYFHQLDSSVVKLKLLYPYTDHFWYFKVDLHNSMYQTIDKNPYYNQNWEIALLINKN